MAAQQWSLPLELHDPAAAPEGEGPAKMFVLQFPTVPFEGFERPLEPRFDAAAIRTIKQKPKRGETQDPPPKFGLRLFSHARAEEESDVIFNALPDTRKPQWALLNLPRPLEDGKAQLHSAMFKFESHMQMVPYLDHLNVKPADKADEDHFGGSEDSQGAAGDGNVDDLKDAKDHKVISLKVDAHSDRASEGPRLTWSQTMKLREAVPMVPLSQVHLAREGDAANQSLETAIIDHPPAEVKEKSMSDGDWFFKLSGRSLEHKRRFDLLPASELQRIPSLTEQVKQVIMRTLIAPHNDLVALVNHKKAKKKGDALSEIIAAAQSVGRLVMGSWVLKTDPLHFGDPDLAEQRSVKRRRSLTNEALDEDDEPKEVLTKRELLVLVRDCILSRLALYGTALPKSMLVDIKLPGMNDLFKDAIAAVGAIVNVQDEQVYVLKFTDPRSIPEGVSDEILEYERDEWIKIGEDARQRLDRALRPDASLVSKVDGKALDASQKRENQYHQLLLRVMMTALGVKESEDIREPRTYTTAQTTLALSKLNKEDSCMILRRVYQLKGTSKKKADEVKKLLARTFNERPTDLLEELNRNFMGKTIVLPR